MRRREFVSLLGGAAAAWPIAARGQQAAMPVIGLLDSTSPELHVKLLHSFRQGLTETGYVEGRNVAIEYRWSDGQYHRVPDLAADLVRRQVTVIAAIDGSASALAAKAATSTIPIIFTIGADPVAFGLVPSLNRPGGNVTGPVQAPTKYELVLNLKTAKALGLEVPPSLLARARRGGRMRRREFITLVGGAAVAWPLAARAQQPARRPRLGILIYSTPERDPNTQSFLRGLRDLGYIDGQNIDIAYRFAEGRPERLRDVAAELVRARPDVIFALGGDVTPFVSTATQTIPIIYAMSADPVQLGVADSLANPGGNATGVTFLSDELAGKRLEVLKEAVPNVSRVGFLWNPDHPDNELPVARRAAMAFGIQLHPVEMRSPGDLDTAFASATQANIDAIYAVSSRHMVASVTRIVDFATKSRLPLAGGWGTWVQAGGLISYGPDVAEMIRLAAVYVDKVLKGAKPAALPVLQPTRFELLINLKTAKALGLNLPPMLLARADKVIE
jgi:putative ABC transport system substrate-binding protein